MAAISASPSSFQGLLLEGWPGQLLQQARPQFLGRARGPLRRSPDGEGEVALRHVPELEEEGRLRQLQQQLQRQPERLPRQLPVRVSRGPSGELTSIGSVGHGSGGCSPCIFVGSPSGCMTGSSCGYCHMPHAKAAAKSKSRPCRGKRRQYARFLARLDNVIRENPDGFRMDDLELPASIASCDAMKARLFEITRSYMHRVKEERSSAGSSLAGQPIYVQIPSLDASASDLVARAFPEVPEATRQLAGSFTAGFQTVLKEPRWITLS